LPTLGHKHMDLFPQPNLACMCDDPIAMNSTHALLLAPGLLQVLDTFVYADRHLLERQPELADAEVYVHFRSSEEVGVEGMLYVQGVGC